MDGEDTGRRLVLIARRYKGLHSACSRRRRSWSRSSGPWTAWRTPRFRDVGHWASWKGGRVGGQGLVERPEIRRALTTA